MKIPCGMKDPRAVCVRDCACVCLPRVGIQTQNGLLTKLTWKESCVESFKAEGDEVSRILFYHILWFILLNVKALTDSRNKGVRSGWRGYRYSWEGCWLTFASDFSYHPKKNCEPGTSTLCQMTVDKVGDYNQQSETYSYLQRIQDNRGTEVSESTVFNVISACTRTCELELYTFSSPSHRWGAWVSLDCFSVFFCNAVGVWRCSKWRQHFHRKDAKLFFVGQKKSVVKVWNNRSQGECTQALKTLGLRFWPTVLVWQIWSSRCVWNFVRNHPSLQRKLERFHLTTTSKIFSGVLTLTSYFVRTRTGVSEPESSKRRRIVAQPDLKLSTSSSFDWSQHPVLVLLESDERCGERMSGSVSFVRR